MAYKRRGYSGRRKYYGSRRKRNAYKARKKAAYQRTYPYVKGTRL